jgi:hypothetical protein
MPLEIDLAYYYGCYGIAVEKEKEKWFYFTGYNKIPIYKPDGDLEGYNIRASAVDSRGIVQTITLRDEGISFPILTPRYLFDGTHSWWFSRLPVREKEKGMTTSNTLLDNPINSVLPPKLQVHFAEQSASHADRVRNARAARLEGRISGAVPKTVNLLNRKFKGAPFGYALKMLKEKGVVTVPINQQWAVSHGFTKQHQFTVFRRLCPVGLFNDDMRGVVINPTFKQEIQDNLPQVSWK